MTASITTRLNGGLGNQMFQYAAGRALALRHDVPLYLDLSHFADSADDTTPRHFELHHFPVVAGIETRRANSRSGDHSGRSRRFDAVRRLLGLAIGDRTTDHPTHYREPHFHFDPHLARIPPPLHMEGYWQSERYFSDCAETIRRELTPSAPLDASNAAIATMIDSVEAVSVHVRRGDYVTNPRSQAFHGVCPLDYYRSAILLIRDRVARPHLFIFSDDQEWTRHNLTLELPMTFVSANLTSRGFRDIQLMSRCRHHVIANSSFSWWGAWLNPSRGKVVVAPARWFAKPDVDVSDLIPADWLRVDVAPRVSKHHGHTGRDV